METSRLIYKIPALHTCKGERKYLTIYFDYILMVCTNKKYICEVKATFLMSDMGQLENYWNVRVTRTRRYLQLDQTVYAQQILTTVAVLLDLKTKTQNCPLPSNAVNRILAKQDQLSAEEQL